MKTTPLLLSLALLTATPLLTRGADEPIAVLQRGLLEEEANHNLEAAIKAYQAVVAQFDDQRKLTATAVFRLGECYRKLGKTNDAITQYQRLLRDYSDQSNLVFFSEQNLVALGAASPRSALAGASGSRANPRQRALILEDMKLAEQQLATARRQVEVGTLPRLGTVRYERAVTRLKRELAVVDEGPSGPTVRQLLEEEIRLQQQVVSDVQQRMEVGRAAAGDQIEPQRELLALKRELAALDEPASDTTPMTSAEAEEVQKIREIIANSPDLINARAGDQGTRLHRAATAGQLSVVRFLLAHGADVNAVDRNGTTALQFAASSGHKAVVEALLAGGAKVQASESPSTALHSAARSGHKLVVTVLLDHGADVNARDNSGCTALHPAVFYHYKAVVEVLLERKADPNVGSQEHYQETNWGFDAGTTPLHVAATRADVPLIELLCARGAEVNARNKSGQTPLHGATGANSKAAVELLLARGADVDAKNNKTPPQTPLLGAAQSGSAEIVEVLVTHGADVNVRDQEGQAPLHWAAIQEAQQKDGEAMARAILARKPDLEVRNRERLTPLQLAVSRNATKVAALLVEAGANVNVVFTTGETPLFWAVERKLSDTVKILLEHKANPNAPNLAGRTPLDLVSATLRSNRAVDDPAWIEMDAALRQAGASEEFSRRFFITVTRKARGLSHQALYKGTNDFNQYTLFELVGIFFQTGAGLAGYQLKFDFVDFAHVKITRLKPEGGTSEFTVDLAAIFKSRVCTDDVPLQWGDVVDFSELDHPLNLGWSGLDPSIRDMLRKCLERKVQIVVKAETTTATLRLAFPPYRDEPVPNISEGLLLSSFRLGDVARSSGLLRSSSDTSRVKVKRTDPETGRKLELVFDLEKINPSTDLWLREGDVIEIPERDPNAPPRTAGSDFPAIPSGVIVSPQPLLPGIPASPGRVIPQRQVRPAAQPDPPKN